MNTYEFLQSIAPELYPLGPRDREIWERSDGNLAQLELTGEGRTQWYRAIRLLERGGGGPITAETLIQKMSEDFPSNVQLMSLIQNREMVTTLSNENNNNSLRHIDLKGKVDFAILTIREDEHIAVLQRFTMDQIYSGERRSYSIHRLPLSDGSYYLIAVAAAFEQGGGQSQALAAAMIEDLDPQWIIVCGIAGAVPHTEFTLGDVIIASRLRDYTVGAAKEGEERQIVDQGGPMAAVVQDHIALLPAINTKMAGWNSEEAIGKSRPLVILEDGQFYGSDPARTETRQAMNHHFGLGALSRAPLVTRRTMVAGNLLVKDTETMDQWRTHGRDIAAIEMELSGVYAAARTRQREYPILAVRGISDVVGFKRQDAWTEYACQSAAAFVLGFLKTCPIPPRAD